MNRKKDKLLIYIVAFNHEKFISKLLNRVPKDLSDKYNVEILINDDYSSDATFKKGLEYIKNTNNNFKFKIFSNPVNQGYGGNQKIGYHYAIINNFDYVALLHGDGQYAPEYLESLIEPLKDSNIDAVFGSRMLTKGTALKGGMPLYKFIGNKILTNFQNFILKSNLSEFHSGYRIYKVNSLKKIPFEINANDYSFDTEIIIQFLIAKLKIKEIAIPTYYGDEISYVNGIKYAAQISIATLKAKLQDLGLFYESKFDCKPEESNNYVNKDSFYSTHSEVLKIVNMNSNVLDVGCNEGHMGSLLKNKKNCNVVGIDKKNNDNKNLYEFISHDLNLGVPSIDYSKYDYILILDLIEHLNNPEKFLKDLKDKLKNNNKAKIVITTPNIAFIIIRVMLFFGQFNYGKRGILDKTHTRLFTFSTLRRLVIQSDFLLVSSKGIPAPYPLAIGENFFSKSLTNLNLLLIKISKSLFSYQIMYEIKPNMSLDSLIERAYKKSEKKTLEIENN
jgi:glycosyltransferase involved in cell wall biosynthesis